MEAKKVSTKADGVVTAQINVDTQTKKIKMRRNYAYENDLQNEKFEKVFANHSLSNFIITNGYFPEYDIKDLDSGLTYEVKRDYWFLETDNVLIEEYFNLEKKKKGWLFHTSADWLIVFITDDIYYKINMYVLRNDFHNNIHDWVKCDIRQPMGFTTRNWLCQLKYFKPKFYNVKH